MKDRQLEVMGYIIIFVMLYTTSQYFVQTLLDKQFLEADGSRYLEIELDNGEICEALIETLENKQ